MAHPRYCRQRRRGQPDLAYVEFSGRRIYLGTYGTKESRAEYRRRLEEWKANGCRLEAPKESLTVLEVTAAFWKHAELYYRKPDGSPSSEQGHYRRLLRDLNELYGETEAAKFGPRALKTLRQRWIDRGLCRKNVNAHVGKVKHVFRWAVEEELVLPATYQALAAVRGLTRGRSAARETPPVRPVPQEHVEAIEPHVSRQVWALVRLHLLTAARSGELLPMRPRDIDTSGTIWIYQPEEHKTAHREHTRRISLWPEAQAVLRPFLEGRAPDAYLFSPAEAERERREHQHAERKTPLSCGNAPGRNRKRSPKRKAGERYNSNSLNRAIRRACEKAEVPPWHPHRLRHSAATAIRKEFGLDAARLILGHRSPAITEVYAELDREKAVEIMKQIG